MKLLVIAATSIELNAIKKWIKSANVKSHLNIDFLCTWVWNYETVDIEIKKILKELSQYKSLL